MPAKGVRAPDPFAIAGKSIALRFKETLPVPSKLVGDCSKRLSKGV